MEKFDPEKTNPRIDISTETIPLAELIAEADTRSRKEAEIVARHLQGKTIRYNDKEWDFVEVAPQDIAIVLRDRETEGIVTLTPEQTKTVTIEG